MHSSVIKTFVAGGVIFPYRILAVGAADGQMVQAADAADALVGVSQEAGASVAGFLVDVAFGGLPEVQYGAAVERGAPLTADAAGKAVPAAPVTGAQVRRIGYALSAGVAGDILPFLFAPGTEVGA